MKPHVLAPFITWTHRLCVVWSLDPHSLIAQYTQLLHPLSEGWAQGVVRGGAPACSFVYTSYWCQENQFYLAYWRSSVDVSKDLKLFMSENSVQEPPRSPPITSSISVSGTPFMWFPSQRPLPQPWQLPFPHPLFQHITTLTRLTS